jgi:two-component system response regulator HydG
MTDRGPEQLRVLIVDDDPGLRMSMAANLEEEGFDVRCAASGAEALALLGDTTPGVDLLLSDVRMPGMSGLELWRRVKTSWPGLPGVLMTAFTAEHVLAGAVREGVYAILHKPFDPLEAIAVVRRAARRLRILLVEPRGAGGAAPLATALSGFEPEEVLSAPDEAQAVALAARADVVVADVDAAGWPALAAVRAAAPHLAGAVAVTARPAPQVAAGITQLAAPVGAGTLRRVIAELRGRGGAS